MPSGDGVRIEIKVVGDLSVRRDLDAAAVLAPLAVARVVRTFGQLLVTRVQAHASGRPGPRAITGDYRRSITMQMEESGAVAVAHVGTNAPQGRRLEYGFVGTDSLGRHYNQPPYPHWSPAIEEIEPQFVTALEAVVDKVVK